MYFSGPERAVSLLYVSLCVNAVAFDVDFCLLVYPDTI